ncbi:hypothetical protein C8Q77DRAFT_1059484 [Trametes polyzona]|nr:hypothetical protein C8Q77DRAFT_1059484 [Trametes polyzona]
MELVGRVTQHLLAAAAKAARPPRRVYQHVPVELWDKVFDHLGTSDLLSLARTCAYLGAIAEARVWRSARVPSSKVDIWAASISPLHRSTAVRVLEVDLKITGVADAIVAVFRLAGAIRQLSDLRELTVTGAELPKLAARDILMGCRSERLERFKSDWDALVLASWPSLARQQNLTEFGGLFGHTCVPPVQVRPSVFPLLHILDTGAAFAQRVDRSSRVANLTVHVTRAMAGGTLKNITEVLGPHLISLRVIRTILCPRTAGNNWGLALAEAAGAMPGAPPFWESDSPVVLCAALRAPNLQFFELRDKVLTSTARWTASSEKLREQPAFGPTFREKQSTSRTPALTTLVWRPVWEKAAKALRPIVLDHVMDIFTLLPVSAVAMPLVESCDRMTAPPDAEGWSTWTKKDVDEGAPVPPPWWEGSGTVEQVNRYACTDELWITH